MAPAGSWAAAQDPKIRPAWISVLVGGMADSPGTPKGNESLGVENSDGGASEVVM